MAAGRLGWRIDVRFPGSPIFRVGRLVEDGALDLLVKGVELSGPGIDVLFGKELGVGGGGVVFVGAEQLGRVGLSLETQRRNGRDKPGRHCP